ncbi:2'-5' RNA ligase family protein [Reichenbachiella carrageenanivorans]|uniref:2'-5' RNA ligase family protein n=1 Tax=Reichenbachiella carrageenanivorans TaxID=2979869 RepID=A0ABY6D7A0_9BACT|nr:2'-5' RNA ligase family protein [Reichenbachiella carrageenanivorans]UXX80938.1 2'-5' RNA ligase family protein [Reichenbachiella carrageenanivorans]
MAKPEYSLYFLALIPDGEIKEEVMAFKREVAAKFSSKGALRSPPHITLHMPFKWRADREEELVNKLTEFRYDDYPVRITLEGFDFFEPRVVFVDVVKSEPLVRLQKELSDFMRRALKLYNADYKDRGFHPHMTIGFRDLKKAIFPEAKAYFQDQLYLRKFEISDICLLKHNGQRWEEWRRF